MRLIGHLDNDKDARTFGDFLYVQQIETEFEREGDQWAIWVRSDDHIAEATKLLAEFRANPQDPKYQAGSPAQRLREQAKEEDEAYRKRVVQGKKLFPGLAGYGFGFVTYTLIVISIGVFLMSKMGDDKERLSPLLITPIEVVGDGYRYLPGWGALRDGEVWRLLTPIVIHFGILHILFNMLWLRDLGSLFEARLGPIYFAAFVLVTGVVSNAAQYAAVGKPLFGGMSGVNYALVGYCWVRGRLDPGAGLHLDRQSLMFALIWFVLCFTPLVGSIANGAHAAGLIAGAAWAFIDSKRK